MPGKKNTRNAKIPRIIKTKIDKIIILNPETKIIVSHVDTNNNACPRSGWLINSITIINKARKEIKYRL